MAAALVVASDLDSTRALDFGRLGDVVIHDAASREIDGRALGTVRGAGKQQEGVCESVAVSNLSLAGVADAEYLGAADMTERKNRSVMLGAGLPSVRVRFLELLVPAEGR